MKYAHLVKINVFSKQEDDENTIIKRLLSLIPFDIEEQRVELKKRTAEGFEHKTIKVFETTLTKEKHVNAFLENLNKKLNKEQLTAVKHKKGSLLIIAGAGTGKTRALVHRIAHLINVEKYSGHKILAVTFTRKAAQEMRTRIAEVVDEIV